MPFCPHCRDEFQDWVTACPDCHVNLVEELPLMPKPVDKRNKLTSLMVHVATAPSEPVAWLWAGILEDQGIQSIMKSDLVTSVHNFPAAIDFRIYVLKSKAKEAKAILAPYIEKTQA